MDWKFFAEIGALLSSVIAVIGFYLTARQFRSQMNVQLFLTFTERYGKIIDSFPPEARQARLDPNVEPPPDTPELRRATLKYLNLCSEEYHLYRSGYISQTIWEMWESKMRRSLRSKLFRRAWAELVEEFDDHPAFQQYVREVLGAK